MIKTSFVFHQNNYICSVIFQQNPLSDYLLTTNLNKKMKKDSFRRKQAKYAIHQLMEKLSYKEYRIAKNKLPIALKVSKRTFERWMYLELGDKTEVPSDKMAMLAKYFNVKMEDMFNFPIPQYNINELKKMEENKFAIEIDLIK